jgi:hypothetical protein
MQIMPRHILDKGGWTTLCGLSRHCVDIQPWVGWASECNCEKCLNMEYKTVTNEQLIARQAKIIEEQKDQLLHVISCVKSAKIKIIGIGGPLNDNYLGFNSKQLKLFALILEELEDCLSIQEYEDE